MDKPRLLIADSSEEFRLALADILQGAYRIRQCSDGSQAQMLIRSFAPDVMVLDLMLPGLDGISLLRWAADAGHRPVVLATTKFVSDYVLESIHALGVGYIMVKPCDVRATAARVTDLNARIHPPKVSRTDSKSQISELLLALGIPVKLKGYAYLREAILLYVKEPGQSITKVLYPDVAKRCGCADIHVERSIRSAIATAWENRDERVWRIYFSPDGDGCISRPTNSSFILRLADIISREKADIGKEMDM